MLRPTRTSPPSRVPSHLHTVASPTDTVGPPHHQPNICHYRDHLLHVTGLTDRTVCVPTCQLAHPERVRAYRTELAVKTYSYLKAAPPDSHTRRRVRVRPGASPTSHPAPPAPHLPRRSLGFICLRVTDVWVTKTLQPTRRSPGYVKRWRGGGGEGPRWRWWTGQGGGAHQGAGVGSGDEHASRSSPPSPSSLPFPFPIHP
jgi:hypothetical protein